MKILVLGHEGMLGSAVAQHITDYTKHKLLVTFVRFPSPVFVSAVKAMQPDCIVNCIGAPEDAEWDLQALAHIQLPKVLEGLEIPIIYPSTIDEFDGARRPWHPYGIDSVCLGRSLRGITKGEAYRWLRKHGSFTTIIRASLVGVLTKKRGCVVDGVVLKHVECGGARTVRVPTDVYGNSITAPEWARQCIACLELGESAPRVLQCASPTKISQYLLCRSIVDRFNLRALVALEKVQSGTRVRRLLISTTPFEVPSMEDQLKYMVREHLY